MKVKMKSLGVTVKSPTPMPVESAKTASKKVVRFPDVTVDSQMPALKGCGLETMKAGMKGQVLFGYEVKSDRSPEEWDIRERGMAPTDRIVVFKLTSAKMMNGEEKKEHGYKNINQASLGARKEMSS